MDGLDLDDIRKGERAGAQDDADERESAGVAEDWGEQAASGSYRTQMSRTAVATWLRTRARSAFTSGENGQGSRGSPLCRSTDTTPMLSFAWLANSLASTISGMPSAAPSTVVQLIMRERPEAIT